jgi:hypothetical protein
MGRLRKSKTDMISKLRHEGYTQLEVAEKVGVHLKTVQKYDPLRTPKKKEGKSAGVIKGSYIEDIEIQLRNLGDFLSAIYLTIVDQTDYAVICPDCNKDSLFSNDKIENGREIFTCHQCGNEIYLPRTTLERK